MEKSLKEISELSGIRIEILRFALVMEEKLKKNDHKGGWKQESLVYLSDRMKEEIDEMNAAIGWAMDGETKIEFEKAQKECADSANFLMMIFDNLETLKNKSNG